MSEANDRKMNHPAPETAENMQIQSEETAPQNEEIQNEKIQNEKSKNEKPKKRKKRKSAKIALSAAALLTAIALLFGVVVGYALGRNAGARRLKDAQAQVQALTEALEDASGAPIYDAFDEELTGENQNALSDLAGGVEAGDVADQFSEDALLGEMLQSGATLDPVVVAEYQGGTLMSDEVALEYDEWLTELVFIGYNEDEIASALLNEVMESMVSERILEAKAKEMGVYDLTEADYAEIDREAQASYAEQMDFYRAYVDVEGMTDEEASGAVKNFMQENMGVSLEDMRAELEETWWMRKAFDAITADVRVDDSALQAAYDARIADQKQRFEAYPDDYEYSQMSGELILYNLEGYRAVRSLLIAFEDDEIQERIDALTDEIAELDAAKDADQIAQAQAELDGYYAQLLPEAQAALDQINSGADFGELMAELGDDNAMKDGALKESGYYLSENSLLYSREMISAAMALENPKDHSGLVRVPEGICILEYVGEVPAGAVSLEDVRDALMEETLDQLRTEAYEAQVDQWLEEAGAAYYPERMQ